MKWEYETNTCKAMLPLFHNLKHIIRVKVTNIAYVTRATESHVLVQLVKGRHRVIKTCSN
jgi:hypothetical protein